MEEDPMWWGRKVGFCLMLFAILLAAACGDDGGAPLGGSEDELDGQALAAAATVPPEVVPADLQFDELSAPADARIRLRRFLLRFQAALHRLDRAATASSNEEAQALVAQAKTEYRAAIQDFREHEPARGIAHLREAARLLLQARRLLFPTEEGVAVG
jgi:hypothetical protein